MKKLLAMLVILSMLVSMAVVVPQAADIPGDWTTYRNSLEYYEPDPETGEVEESYRAAAGYTYTEEGFTIVPADYTGTNPFMKVETKDKHNLKDGLYLKFRIDSFSYKGEEGKADEWICVCFGSEVNYCPGTGNPNGGGILIRGKGDGSATSSFGDSTVNISPEIVDGCEIYTYEIEWTGSEYSVVACGVPYTPAMNAAFTTKMEGLDSNGDLYVGLALHSNVANGTAALTILEYGTSKADAETPQGSDSKEPEPNTNATAPIADPSTIEANNPCVLWDASSFDAPVGNGGFTAAAMGDNAFHFTVTSSPFFFSWNVPKNISYNVEDFPILTMMVKDFWNSGIIWYNCGEIMGPTTGYNTGFSLADGIYYEGDEYGDYTLVVVDLTDLCSGRINNFRIDIHGVDLESPEFDICYMGCFRSVEEAKIYGANYLGVDLSVQETEAPTEEGDEKPTEEASEELTEEITQNPAGDATEANTNGTVTTDPADGDKGCSSVIGSVAVLLTAAAAAFVLKKKD